jgi:hypothetical protein
MRKTKERRRMMEVKVTKTTNPKVKPDPATVPFGVAFTDHMFMMEYDSENGWQNPRIVPFGDISLNHWYSITAQRFLKG